MPRRQPLSRYLFFLTFPARTKIHVASETPRVSAQSSRPDLAVMILSIQSFPGLPFIHPDSAQPSFRTDPSFESTPPIIISRSWTQGCFLNAHLHVCGNPIPDFPRARHCLVIFESYRYNPFSNPKHNRSPRPRTPLEQVL